MPNLRPLDSNSLKTRFVSSIADISPDDWNRLCSGASPFLRHEFLLALENSGSTTAATGWEPCHLLVEHASGVVAAMPLFRKSHSWGEYVFDWSWAEAYHGNGLEYYPKLLSAIPFTPSTAPRLLIHPDHVDTKDLLLEIMLGAVIDHARDSGIGSWHILFPHEEQSRELGKHGLLSREACQFHWFNRNYLDFDDFLQAFSSRKRKNLRKEREAVSGQGVSFEHFTGPNITEEMWDTFYLFYQSTYHVRGQSGYLTRKFFSEVGRSMPESLLLVMARMDGRYIAGALSFRDEHKLYGRYWGALADFQFLHFETCYYQGIEYCIANGLESFDSGAQGEHKIQRGFEPVRTFSNHWIADQRFRKAIADFTEKERLHINAYIEQAKAMLPFRKNGDEQKPD